MYIIGLINLIGVSLRFLESFQNFSIGILCRIYRIRNILEILLSPLEIHLRESMAFFQIFQDSLVS